MGLEIGITKALDVPLVGSKLVFNSEMSLHINQSARCGVDVKDVFLWMLNSVIEVSHVGNYEFGADRETMNKFLHDTVVGIFPREGSGETVTWGPVIKRII